MGGACPTCEHTFVSSKASSCARFQRALDAGDLQAVRIAALELPYVNLPDALRICVLMKRKKDPRFERAAVRWLARLSLARTISAFSWDIAYSERPAALRPSARSV
jgi:hypothetical protein